jgi:predicted DNA repair protein MutK
MASGLIALLDDVAAIAKLAAATVDDVAAASAKAGTKAAGVVIDDAAVTPGYVVGLTPDRELPIIGKITLGSLRNKLLILLPAALLMSTFAPWLLTPLLMIGGSYLCFEAAEKLWEALTGHGGDADLHVATTDPVTLEHEQVTGAIRTDFILSGEIMAIALAEVAEQSTINQGLILAIVAVVITVGVYGAVALIVKMDDIGLHLIRQGGRINQLVGNLLVSGMTRLLAILSVVGTAAMAWVGGGIVLHGMEQSGLASLPHALHHFAELVGHAVPLAETVLSWLAGAVLSGIFGVLLGAAIVAIHHAVIYVRRAGLAVEPQPPV